MSVTIHVGDSRDVLRTLPDQSVHCIVTSPPYFGLRDYGVDGQMGLEETPEAYVAGMVALFREARRVLRDDGTLFLNLGDSYFGSSQTGGTNSKEGSAKRAGRMFARDGRAQAYDNGGTEGSGSLGRGSSSESRGDGRTGAWWSRIADTDVGLALAQVAEPLSQSLAHIESFGAHLPNGGSSHRTPTPQSLLATADQARIAARAVERLRASLPTTLPEFVPPLPAGFRLSDMLSACLSSLHSFAACAQAFADTSGAQLETPERTANSASPYEELAHRIQCTAGCCSMLLSWLEYKPQRSTLKPKDLIGIPWRVAFALQADGWYLRQDIIWHKPNPMPESVADRCTKAHEYVFLLSKSPRYFYDAEAIAEPAATGWNDSEFHTGKTAEHQLGRSSANRKPRPAGNKTHKYVTEYEAGGDEHRTKAGLLAQSGIIYETRNKRSVWSITTQPYSEAHFATMAPDLAETCIKAGCPKGGVVLDPFGGAGTTGLVADRLQRNAVLIELNPEYAAMARARISGDAGIFSEVA